VRRGAAAYVLKDRFDQLGEAVTHALQRARAERARRDASVAERHRTLAPEVVATVRAQVEELANEPDALRLDVQGELSAPPPPAIGEAVYHITREAIANAVQQGDASRVSITFEERDTGLLIQIEDDGGASDPEVASGGQPQLASIRQRAESSGGWSRIERAPLGGTVVSCWLPAAGPNRREGSSGEPEPGR
jgi:nitrate/nitrite-specific signal transduction histidine kinase